MQLGFYTYPAGTKIQNTANGQYNSGISFTYNQWNHLFATFDGTNLKTYINGLLVNTKAITNSLLPRTNLTIGARCRGTNSYDCYFNGKINDVRIYDHCLSDKEVEEISKGLILHYKLDGGPTFPAKNLLLESTKDKGESHTTYNIADFNFSEALVSGGNYTIIAKINTSVEKKGVCFYHSGGSIVMGKWNPISADGIYKVHFTATSSMASQTSGSGHGFCRVYVSNNSASAQGSTTVTGTANVEWIILYNGSGDSIFIPAEEYSNICYDSSGYNHNGTIIGKYAITTSDKRYKSAFWTDKDGYISIGTQLYQMRDEMTVNVWINKTWSLNVGTPFSSVEGGGFGWQCNGANYTFYCGTGTSSNTYISKAITVNNLSDGWHMLSATYNGLALKVYIDGELNSTVNKYSTKTPLYYNNNSGMFVGRESSGNTNTSNTDSYRGSICDVRIYATALTAAQVKELYNTSATIDNLGNAYARELVE